MPGDPEPTPDDATVEIEALRVRLAAMEGAEVSPETLAAMNGELESIVEQLRRLRADMKQHQQDWPI